MRRLYTITVLLLCAVMLAACGKRAEIDCVELAEKLNAEVGFDEPLTELDAAGAERYFNINPNGYTEVEAYVSTRGVCDEFVIVKTDSASSVTSKIKDHIERLKKEYAEYRPDEVKKLDNAVVESYKGTVIMIISPDADHARAVYENYLKN